MILKAHRATQNDLSGRFKGPNPNGTRQQSTPFQVQSDDYDSRIAAAVAAWSTGGIGEDEQLTPMVASAIKADDPDGVLAEWESAVDAESLEKHFSDGNDKESLLMVVQQMEAKMAAMSEAMNAQSEEVASLRSRPAPPTRANAFDTPAVSAPRYTTIPSASIPPFDPMRQLANTPAVMAVDRDVALARASDEKVKKATGMPSAAPVGKITGAAYAGKAISAFESEKMVLSARADSPTNAFKILCLQAWRLLSSGTSGLSVSVLACLLTYRMRGPLQVFVKQRWSTFSSTTILLVQWAAATTLLSARMAFSDMATRFFQTGFTYFGGQVATLTALPVTRSLDIREQIDTPPADLDY